MEISTDLEMQIKRELDKKPDEQDNIRLQILYNRAKNALIEQKKEKLLTAYQLALDEFKNIEEGTKLSDTGRLEYNIVKDELHNIIANSNICKTLDSFLDDYTLNDVIVFNEYLGKENSPVYLAVITYRYLCQIQEEEKKQIDNNIVMLRNILGSYITEQTKELDNNTLLRMNDPKKKESYIEMWHKANNNAVKFYMKNGKIGKRDYTNLVDILSAIDKVFNYYIYGPKTHNMLKLTSAKVIQKKSS